MSLCVRHFSRFYPRQNSGERIDVNSSSSTDDLCPLPHLLKNR
jgi:hypothetical protein